MYANAFEAQEKTIIGVVEESAKRQELQYKGLEKSIRASLNKTNKTIRESNEVKVLNPVHEVTVSNPVEKVQAEIINQPEIQKVKVLNQPEIKVEQRDVVFPEIQKIESEQLNAIQKALIGITERFLGVLSSIIKVDVQNKVQVETDIPIQIAGKRTDARTFIPVRLTDGQDFYVAAFTSTTAAPAGAQAVRMKQWLREEFTYDGSGNVTQVVRYDNIMKEIEGIEYDVNGNISTITRRVESING